MATDPYDAVLADLRAKRDQLDQAIAAIESLRGGAMSATGGAVGETHKKQAPQSSGPGALLGYSIVDAAKKLLSEQRRPLRNPEIASLFKAGGLVLNSKEPANTIGSVLTRRQNEVGDIVRVDRGTWGLKEWYPNRRFGPDKKGKGEDQANGQTEPSDTEDQDGGS